MRAILYTLHVGVRHDVAKSSWTLRHSIDVPIIFKLEQVVTVFTVFMTTRGAHYCCAIKCCGTRVHCQYLEPNRQARMAVALRQCNYMSWLQ